MRAWTIQTRDVAEALCSGRTWYAHEPKVAPDWRHAYQWMRDQMTARLGPPAVPTQMPVWLWCQWRGSRRARPDLRYVGHLPSGTAGVRIELELDETGILRSDFELWHYVLNGWYLPGSPADEREFDARPDRARIEPSWQRIFDLDRNNRRYTSSRDEKSIQGVTWCMRPEDVRAVTHFIAR